MSSDALLTAFKPLFLDHLTQRQDRVGFTWTVVEPGAITVLPAGEYQRYKQVQQWEPALARDIGDLAKELADVLAARLLVTLLAKGPGTFVVFRSDDWLVATETDLIVTVDWLEHRQTEEVRMTYLEWQTRADVFNFLGSRLNKTPVSLAELDPHLNVNTRTSK